ncbi:hypothetical protein K432DRAFT_159234 [Lepidopterella palustris CBS 459.81]|uniref:Uncharacterized protein n=1 Tax=Lepidopterella palustris CBS 459.81 TaxID=1314670 RepID=A0A8E2EH73_9PEZI|nr:hypothetical protein K432DRAFT_159234 [Lepidopterella palustris CBS 459.81]
MLSRYLPYTPSIQPELDDQPGLGMLPRIVIAESRRCQYELGVQPADSHDAGSVKRLAMAVTRGTDPRGKRVEASNSYWTRPDIPHLMSWPSMSKRCLYSGRVYISGPTDLESPMVAEFLAYSSWTAGQGGRFQRRLAISDVTLTIHHKPQGGSE